MHDIAEFLRGRDPFDGLDEDALASLAHKAEVEFFPAGSVIFEQGAAAQDHVRVVRRGAVELVDAGTPLDLLGEGELFGHPSMLSGLPTGFAVRAAEDTLCYRFASADVLDLLTRPAGVRYVARSLRDRGDLAGRTQGLEPPGTNGAPVRSFVREQPIVCDPDVSIRAAAQRMVEESASCVLVRTADGLGILTDRDLRERVVAVGLSVDAPVREAMSFPAVRVTPERPAQDVMIAMLDRGVRHLPVVEPGGHILGVVTDLDLLASQTRSPFTLRRAITAAGSVAEVRDIVRRLPQTIVSLHDAGTAPGHISAVISVVADALTRRLLQLLLAEAGRSDVDIAWLATGSHGRREVVPGSDVDSALVWPDSADAEVGPLLQRVAAQVIESLELSGFSADPHGATARDPLFARSVTGWREAFQRWIADPGRDKVLIVLSAMLDGRPIVGAGSAGVDVIGELRSGRNRVKLQRWILRLALAHKPPTGFLRNIVVEHGGEHQGRFDIKRGGLLPIVDIARYAGLVAGVPVVSTVERLQAAASAGVLTEADAGVLREAYHLFFGLRLEHQVEQLRAGMPPDDFIDPGSLNDLTRRYVRDAFRAVAGVQRGLNNAAAAGA
jgi:CBS domain-containing protein